MPMTYDHTTKNQAFTGKSIFLVGLIYMFAVSSYSTEFRYSVKVKNGVDNLDQLHYVYDQGWNMSPSNQAFVYVDNHDTQRNGGVITYKVKRGLLYYQILQSALAGCRNTEWFI